MAADLEITKHIYGAPSFPHIKQPSTALVLGANGISGWNMVQELAAHPDRWSTVYSMSRSPPSADDAVPPNVKHISADLFEDPKNIAKCLTDNNVKADYVFFFAYLQVKSKEGQPIWSEADEMTRVNTTLLANLLQALEIAQVVPKRFLLQTGAKHYGLTAGIVAAPLDEDFPRVLQGGSNFYYPQEDLLFEYSKRNNVPWNVTRPSNIIGFARRAFMNWVIPIAIYASVQKKINKKLEWPGDGDSYDNPIAASTAYLSAMAMEWIVLNDHVKDQAFNTEDGLPFTWSRTWPRIAKLYGMEYTTPADDEKAGNVKYKEIPFPYPNVKGYGPQVVKKYKFTLTEWASQKEVKDAYLKLAEEQGLPKDYIDDRELFAFGDNSISPMPLVYTMAKARKNGFFATADPTEMMVNTIKDMIRFKIVPVI